MTPFQALREIVRIVRAGTYFTEAMALIDAVTIVFQWVVGNIKTQPQALTIEGSAPVPTPSDSDVLRMMAALGDESAVQRLTATDFIAIFGFLGEIVKRIMAARKAKRDAQPSGEGALNLQG